MRLTAIPKPRAGKKLPDILRGGRAITQKAIVPQSGRSERLPSAAKLLDKPGPDDTIPVMISTARVRLIPCVLATLFAAGCVCCGVSGHRTRLFDGHSLAGWEGDQKLWRVENGEIVGGHLGEKQPRNEFLATVANYTNFVLRVKFKLSGT